MEIKPKIGIDHICLGMSMDEVRNLWGQPESIKRFFPLKDRSEDNSVNWEYSNATDLSFDNDDNFLLGCITTRSENASLEGMTFIGENIDDLKSKYPNIKLDDDFEENGQDYVLSELKLSFWIIDEIVDSITIFPEYVKVVTTQFGPEKM